MPIPLSSKGTSGFGPETLSDTRMQREDRKILEGSNQLQHAVERPYEKV